MSRKAITLLIIGILLVALIPVSQSQGNDSPHPWPTIGNDLKNTGRSEIDTSHTNGTVKWNATHVPDVQVSPSPVVDDQDTVYISNIALYGFSEGEVVFKFTPDDDMTTSPPAIGDDGTIYVGSSHGYLYAFDRNTEEILWKFDAGSTIRTPPKIGSGGEIYFGTNDGILFAIHDDGSEMWSFDITDINQPEERSDIVTSIAMDDHGNIYFGSLDYHIYSVDSAGGYRWSTSTDFQVWSSPTIAEDGTIYVGTFVGLLALNSQGEVKWEYEVITEGEAGEEYRGVMGSPVLDEDGTIYFGALDNELYALSPDGELEWTFKTDGIIVSSPALGDDGTLYFGSYDTAFYALEADFDRNLRWYFNETMAPFSASPAIGSDGTIFIADDMGIVYAFTGEHEERRTPGFSLLALIGGTAIAMMIYCKKINPKTS